MTPLGFAGRVAVGAAAVGAGAIVALAVAAPASADDSGPRDSGSRSSAVDHPAARASRAPAGHRGPAVGERSGNPDRAKPAAVISAPRLVRPASTVPAPAAKSGATALTPPGPASPAPAEVSSAAPTPAAAAAQSAPTPAATVPSPQSLFFDPRGRKITVLKGVHFVIPQSWAFFVKQVSGSGTFTTDSIYDLKDVDQYDWNKFTGIAFSPLQHDRNSAMVGWRYNLTTQQFEIAPFYNVNKERILPNEKTEVISVPAGETFTYNVDYTGVTISYADKTVVKPYPSGLTPNIWTATRVSGWFGGNEVAPRKLTYYLKLR